MKKQFKQIYQFKITLDGIKPSIWRRIQVPEIYSFWDLHVAIQDAMGWSDSHLHQFEIKNPKTGEAVEISIPDEEWEDEALAGWDVKIADYFSMKNPEALYIYDFGDNWEHTIKLEKIMPRDGEAEYPICLDGKRACPPDDCGGFPGYEDLLMTISDPDSEEYEETIDWLGDDFDPEHFEPDDVIFDDPDERRKFVQR
ncbi:MAG TPA: plasmid pRiA4b ORF-3 family protein [bacterium]